VKVLTLDGSVTAAEVASGHKTDAGANCLSMSGDLPVMNAQCVPFQQIPHTSRLFLDYLAYTPSVREFFPRSPLFPDWLKQEAALVRYDQTRREKVSTILDRQNRAWGASAKTLANLDRLRRGALTVVTGQQVGLFGGPLFSIFKALSAVKLAEQAASAGVDCVPVFWLATEDHDLAEVNHVSLFSSHGLPEKIVVDSHGIPDAPVGTIKFGPEIETAVSRAAALLGDSEVTAWLRDSYRSGETLGSGFARLFARLFADRGVILLDPDDAEFHQLAQPLFQDAIEMTPELDKALLTRGKALENANYHQQVKVTAATTLLFEVHNGARTVVRRKANGSNGGEFQIGLERLSKRQLLERISSAPENFNPNVLFRPVVQDYLLPTLAYTGGAAEVAYFAQVAVVYEKLLGRVTPVLPRFSATLVEPKAERILSRYHLTLGDLFHGPEKVRETIAARSLPQDLQTRFSEALASADQSMGSLSDSIRKLDPTLVRAADRAHTRMKYQVERLQRQAAHAELLRNEVINRHTDSVCNALYPHKTLQEREIAGVVFLACYGLSLLENLYDAIRVDCHDHQLIPIQ
jgi:bacillithiol biosynthesis cysteine-adding enzyme BshC